MTEITSNTYKDFIKEIKNKIHLSQIKAAISVNKELLELYWFIGESIVERQKKSSWGNGFIKSISKDLQLEFPNAKGFSLTNVNYMKKLRISGFWRFLRFH